MYGWHLNNRPECRRPESLLPWFPPFGGFRGQKSKSRAKPGSGPNSEARNGRLSVRIFSDLFCTLRFWDRPGLFDQTEGYEPLRFGHSFHQRLS